MTDHVDAYLARLDLSADLPPTLATLRLVHRRHLDRVPYENVAIMLSRPETVSPAASLARIVERGRAGYCFHHNGALELVLDGLGFDVRRWHAHVWTQESDRGKPDLTHLVLEVSGLPDEGNPGGRWWFDVGLGDGFLDPLPLVDGVHVQAPFRYEITGLGEHGWSFRHDPRGSFGGVEVRDLPVGQEEVEVAHRAMSTPPGGAFTRLSVAQRRLPGRAEVLRGILVTEVDAEGAERTELTSYDAWREALRTTMNLSLDDIDEHDLRALHARMLAAHDSWVGAGRP